MPNFHSRPRRKINSKPNSSGDPGELNRSCTYGHSFL
jgi:hypothetical protein